MTLIEFNCTQPANSAIILLIIVADWKKKQILIAMSSTMISSAIIISTYKLYFGKSECVPKFWNYTTKLA